MHPLHARRSKAGRSALRWFSWEAVERRVLLSAYAVKEFGSFGVNSTGANPRSTLIADLGGNLYGTTSAGGPNSVGTVFQIAAGSKALTTLASFNGTNGAQPYGGVTLDASGDLFGTTYQGGIYNYGTIFEIAKGSSAITTLISFNGTDGEYPYAGLTPDGSGNFYGTTQEGGPGGGGAIFEISPAITTFTLIASINSNTGGYVEGGVAIDASHNLYGTEYSGGASQQGCVFEVANGSTTVTTLASFNQTSGTNPQAGVTLDASGDIYGTTSSGGASNCGTVFEIAAGSNAITALASFNVTDGAFPQSPLTRDSSGDLYGTAASGGSAGYGTVFEIAAGSTAITTILSFSGSIGAGPHSALMLDAAGNLYGTTFQGASGDDGTVFEIAHASASATVLATFDGTNATAPWGGLAFDASGNLYGTTEQGGTNGLGTAFEIPSGSSHLTALASFNGTNGSYPMATPTIDAAGNVYGTASQGGANNVGAVFEIARGSNAITTVASFDFTNGIYPVAGLTLDASGDLFGTTEGGGAHGNGTVFEITKGSNAPTILASFDSSVTQSAPTVLTLDPSGNLYGTTYSGGPGGDGTVFEIAKGSNSITMLAAFSGANGQFPEGGVVRDPAGNLYGATQQGGPNGYGVLFELPSGATMLTTLAAFTIDTGTDASRLSIDASGNLFGATQAGGDAFGHVFELAKGSAMITSLMAFGGTNGASPQWGVTLDAFGNLYGTTESGGPGGAGTAYELAANSAVSLTLGSGSNPSSSNQPLSFTATVSGGVPDGETVSLLDVSNNNAVMATSTLSSGSATLNVTAGTLAVGTHSLFAVYGGDANYAASESAAYVQTMTAPSLPSYITASSGAAFTYNGSTGAVSLTSGTLTFTADNTTAPLANLTASGSASGVFFQTNEHLAGLTLSGGAQASVLSLGSARTHSNHNVLVIGALGSANDPTFSLDSASKLNLEDNDLVVHTGSSDHGNGVPNQLGVPETNELGTVQALAALGRNVPAGSVLNGTWNGNGLSSSSAASGDAAAGYEQNVLAVVQNSDQILGKLSAWTVGSFSEPLGSNDILVKYTYNGDAALEGFVGDNSVTILNGFYDGGKSAQNDWGFGAFTGNGKVDDNDITILNGLYGLGTGSANGSRL